ncbi:MAG: cell division protein ZipA C-terminal FtsZ-binding domain-containing protein [Fimbriimonadaceae bacterium]
MTGPLDPETVFGRSLRPDSTVALTQAGWRMPPPDSPLAIGVRYVIELVGDRSVEARPIRLLLEDDWQRGLGRPDIWVMSGSDRGWRQLGADDATPHFDSVALTWDIVQGDQALSKASCEHLERACEDLARAIGRRAVAVPRADDIEDIARNLSKIRDGLDVGCEFGVVAPAGRGLSERDIWLAATDLGFVHSPTGLFEFRIPNWDLPVLTIQSWGESARFSLAAAAQSVRHPAVGVGFSVPVSPDPETAFRCCLAAVRHLAERTAGTVVDEDENPLTDRGRQRMEEGLFAGLSALQKAGVPAGSHAARALFAP